MYWQLPQEVGGNRLGAYGGNLTIIQRYVSQSGDTSPLRRDDPAVIIRSGGGKSLIYNEENLIRKSSKEIRNKLTILPGSWIVDEGGNQDIATREDIMDVLTDIKVKMTDKSLC